MIRAIAEESFKTKRLREKLEIRLQKEESLVTSGALDRKIEEIHRKIASYSHHREVLTDKTISLFDEGKNAAPLSQKVKKLAESLMRSKALEGTDLPV